MLVINVCCNDNKALTKGLEKRKEGKVLVRKISFAIAMQAP